MTLLRSKAESIMRASRGVRKMRARERKKRDDLIAQAKITISSIKDVGRELGRVLKPWALEENRLNRLRERVPADLDAILEPIAEPMVRAGIDELLADRVQHLQELIQDWKAQ